jgi:hypothetical protein
MAVLTLNFRPLVVRATAQPNKPPKFRAKLTPKDVRREIDHARLICYNFEETSACQVAWDRVEEISSALARQRERELYELAICIEEDDPIACREYDV